ncbi:MarR family winged helix-turn-helix transcriptional regulator [Dinoroseobacter sp. S76]|uniref:MarR family winged helix-turn-helix transcriptional regulator n=1 Tax=Dinoroseobacter sp. S76 TaxID=3415124 RepID=UPI003C7BAE6B
MTKTDFNLDTFLPYQFNVAAGRLSRQFARRYRERFGISVAEWRVVAHLSQSGTVSVREIHERVDMDKSKVSRAAARLEAAGYLTKFRSESDKRLVDLTLTEKGRAMMVELAEVANAYQAEVLSQLGTDAAALQRQLSRLTQTGEG